ncbi:MAG: hypothetical protein JRG94_12100 [Deltaproteobacteria bacterium]|nr:hypothetical protein [Deltaproteobacteria bacterium]
MASIAQSHHVLFERRASCCHGLSFDVCVFQLVIQPHTLGFERGVRNLEIARELPNRSFLTREFVPFRLEFTVFGGAYTSRKREDQRARECRRADVDYARVMGDAATRAAIRLRLG